MIWIEHVIRYFLKIGLIFYDPSVPNQVEDECSQDNDNRQSHKQRCANGLQHTAGYRR